MASYEGVGKNQRIGCSNNAGCLVRTHLGEVIVK
jgi:hypothetical protein